MSESDYDPELQEEDDGKKSRQSPRGSGQQQLPSIGLGGEGEEEEEYEESEVEGEEGAGGDAGNIRTSLGFGSLSQERKSAEKKKKKQFSIWPDLEDKFRPGDVQRLIERLLKEQLEGTQYDAEESPKTAKNLAELINERVKSLKYKRYKVVTCVVLGEARGEAASVSTRALWDPMCDCLANHSFQNETLFCSVTVYGIYYY